jgi:hypothetical protein
MDFLTEPPFGTDAHAVADDQHPQHQVGIDRGPADSAVERPQLCTDALQINKPVDAAKQMIPWHIIIEAEIIEQLRRRDLHAHHRPAEQSRAGHSQQRCWRALIQALLRRSL